MQQTGNGNKNLEIDNSLEITDGICSCGFTIELKMSFHIISVVSLRQSLVSARVLSILQYSVVSFVLKDKLNLLGMIDWFSFVVAIFFILLF